MDIDYRLIKNCHAEEFPFHEGERILVEWLDKRWPAEYGTITKIYTSQQWGHEVVYASMVLLDSQERPACISPNLFRKIDKEEPREMVTPVQQSFDFDFN